MLEIINGIPYAMSPAPNRKHQAMAGELYLQLQFYSKEQGGPCKVYIAPFDVRLPEGSQTDGEIETVVQPDIVVVCDNSKLDDKGCKGAPDWTGSGLAICDFGQEQLARADSNGRLM